MERLPLLRSAIHTAARDPSGATATPVSASRTESNESEMVPFETPPPPVLEVVTLLDTAWTADEAWTDDAWLVEPPEPPEPPVATELHEGAPPRDRSARGRRKKA